MTWTASDYVTADKALGRRLTGVQDHELLQAHGPLRSHCGGWEVAFWPCPLAADVLSDVLCSVTHFDRALCICPACRPDLDVPPCACRWCRPSGGA